jgi:two-component system, NarL family, nitrate/nitrite response regulator NarL
MGDIQVVLADNQPLTLSGLRSAVADHADIQVLAECQNRERLMDAVRNHSPDVLLVSTEILQEELGVLERLVTEMESTRVIVLTSRKDPDFLEGALRCGAKGIFQREWPIQQIPIAIRKVTSGGVWLEQSAAEKMLEEILNRRKTPDQDERKIATLTAREREVIGLICQGMRNKEIASQLHISGATVSHHLTSIFRKLEVEDRTSLVIYSAKQGLATF